MRPMLTIVSLMTLLSIWLPTYPPVSTLSTAGGVAVLWFSGDRLRIRDESWATAASPKSFSAPKHLRFIP